jgi:hypothetical protein
VRLGGQGSADEGEPFGGAVEVEGQ